MPLLVCVLPALGGDLADLPATRTDLTPKDLARVEAITAPANDFSKPEPFELMQGGAGTSKKRVNADAFSQSSANITFEEEGTFKLGNALFRKLWVSSPSSTQASDGLGPLFNARACQSCHLKDGRGHPPEGNADATSMFLRLARAAETEEETPGCRRPRRAQLPRPDLWRAVAGSRRARPRRRRPDGASPTTEVPVTLGDGTTRIAAQAELLASTTSPTGRSTRDTTLSPRVTPQMIGLGLVEQIHPADILAHADPDDADGDGISGKAVDRARRQDRRDRRSAASAGRRRRRRSASRSADAFAGDIGISTPGRAARLGRLHRGAGRLPRHADRRAGSGSATPRRPIPVLDLVTFYSQNLAVPARRDIGEPEVLRGKAAVLRGRLRRPATRRNS